MGSKNKTFTWASENPNGRTSKASHQWDLHLRADEEAVGEPANNKKRKAKKPSTPPPTQNFKSQIGDDHDFLFDCPCPWDIEKSKSAGDSKAAKDDKVQKDAVLDSWDAY